MIVSSEIPKKLKILFLVPGFPSISETFIVNQIIDLINKGHDVRIFALERNHVPVHPKIEEYGLLDRTIFADIPANVAGRISRFFSILSGSSAINRGRLLKTLNIFRYKLDAVKLSAFYQIAWLSQTKDNFDIVHAHFGYMYPYYFHAKACGFFSGAELVVTFHGHDMMPADIELNQIRYKKLFDSNTCITTNNNYGKSLLQLIRPDYPHINLLPVGLDTAYYAPSPGNESRETIILFCGRLINLKGPMNVIEIANELICQRKYTRLFFKLIGDGREEEILQLQSAINKYNLQSQVMLPGPKLQDEVIRDMDHAAVFILPGITDAAGRAENQGLVIQEAQAMELPVIVSDAGGMKYGVIDGVTGYVAREGDISGMCDRLEELILDSALRRQFGKAGRAMVTERYDVTVLGQQLVKIYHQLLTAADRS